MQCFLNRWHGYERVKETCADSKQLKTKMAVRLMFSFLALGEFDWPFLLWRYHNWSGVSPYATKTSILPAIREKFVNEVFYLQQDGAPPLYHQDVRAYLDDTVPGQWIGRRGPIEYPLRSPDLTPLASTDGVPWRMKFIYRSQRQGMCYEIPLEHHVQSSHWAHWQP